MPRARLTRGRGWGGRGTRSRSRGRDFGTRRGSGRARRRISTTPRVDHGLDEAFISSPELIPEAQAGLIVGVGVPPHGPSSLIEAHVTGPAIPTVSSIMDKTRIPLLAKSAKDRFTLFHGGTDPWVACTWLEEIEFTFEYMSCSDMEKVELAAYHLRGQASTWWKRQKTVFSDQTISWQSFREAFERQYFPTPFYIARRQEFMSLKQGDRSVMEYNAEFSLLAEFCSHMVDRDYDRMFHFTQGLAAYIRLKMSEFPIATYRETLDRAIFIEMTQQQVLQEKEASRQTPQTSRSRQQSRGRRPHSQDTTRESSRSQKMAKVSQGSTRPLPSQRGQIPVKCFRCGAQNHVSSECPLDQRICYYCKLPGHMQKDCTLRAQHQAGGSQSHSQSTARPSQSRHQRGPQRSQSYQQRNPPLAQSIQQPQLYHLQSQERSEYHSIPPLQQYMAPAPQQYLPPAPQQYLPPAPPQYLLPPPQQYLSYQPLPEGWRKTSP